MTAGEGRKWGGVRQQCGALGGGKSRSSERFLNPERRVGGEVWETAGGSREAAGGSEVSGKSPGIGGESLGLVSGVRRGWRRDWAGGPLEETGISGRDLGIGGKSIYGRFWEAVGRHEYQEGVSGQGNGQQEGTDRRGLTTRGVRVVGWAQGP